MKAFRAWLLRKRIAMQIEHIQWVREQLAWGQHALDKAERKYNTMRADLWSLEAPVNLIRQGSGSIKRRAA